MARSSRAARDRAPLSLYPAGRRLRKSNKCRCTRMLDLVGARAPSRTGRWACGLLSPGAQELLNGSQDRVPVRNLADHHVLLLLGQLGDIVEELAAAVRALHLAVPEQIQLRQHLLGQQLHALGHVVPPVVPVREVERVDVPILRRVPLVDDLVRHVVGRADLRPAALPSVVKGVLVHLLGDRVVNDVQPVYALVVGLDPGVDPERLDPDDLLLLVGHRARDVHHVNDRRHRIGLGDDFPAAVLLVLPDRDDLRLLRNIGSRRDLPLEGPAEGALEVAQRFRPDPADTGVLVLLRDDVLLAAGLDPREGQLLPEDGGQLFHRQLDLEDVPARLVPGLRLPLALGRGERLADLALADADAAGVFLAVPELRDLDGGQGNADEVVPLLADHLATGDVLGQVAFDLAPDDLPEPLEVALDLLSHGRAPLVSGRGGEAGASVPRRRGRREMGWGCPEPPGTVLMAAPSGLTRFIPSRRSGPHPSPRRTGYFLVWPRAKMLATKVSTSVALLSL